ncbi:MAG: hypothetical protein AB7V19_04745, partial [Candidatus Bipolaricaulia bacterium]
MKWALVLTLVVVVAAAVAGSAQLQGEWNTLVWLDLSPTFDLAEFYSFFDIQYLMGGWMLEAAALVDQLGLN